MILLVQGRDSKSAGSCYEMILPISGSRGYYGFINVSDPFSWGVKGPPLPDADCLDGDMIMCLLADQGIQGNILLKFEISPFLYQLIARNVGAIGPGRAFGPLWISSHCRNSTPKTGRAPTTDERTK